MDKERISSHREFLKDTLRLQIDFRNTDQNRGQAPPPIQKPPKKRQALIDLSGPGSFAGFHGTDLVALRQMAAKGVRVVNVADLMARKLDRRWTYPTISRRAASPGNGYGLGGNGVGRNGIDRNGRNRPSDPA